MFQISCLLIQVLEGMESCRAVDQVMNTMRGGKEDNWCWDRESKGQDTAIFGPIMNMVLFNWFNWFSGTTAVFGTKRLNGGNFYWELQTGPDLHLTPEWNFNPLPAELDDYMMFGVGTKNARVSSDGAVHLIGETDQSWGLDNKGFIWHNGQQRSYLPPFGGPSRIGVCFNGTQGKLSFSVNGRCPGVAFEGLDQIKENIFPMVSSTIYKSELVLLQRKTDYLSLLDRCRRVITKSLVHPSQTRMLELPLSLEEYVDEDLSLPKGIERGIHDVNGLETAKWTIEMHQSWYAETYSQKNNRVTIWLVNMIKKVLEEAGKMHQWYFIEKSITRELTTIFDYYWITKCISRIDAIRKRVLPSIKPLEEKTKLNVLYQFPLIWNRVIPQDFIIPPLVVRKDAEDAFLLSNLMEIPHRGFPVVEPPVFGSNQLSRDLCILRGIQSSVKIVRNYYTRLSMEYCKKLNCNKRSSTKFPAMTFEANIDQTMQDIESIKNMLWKMIIFPYVKQPLGITYIRTCCYICEILSRGL